MICNKRSIERTREKMSYIDHLLKLESIRHKAKMDMINKKLEKIQCACPHTITVRETDEVRKCAICKKEL